MAAKQIVAIDESVLPFEPDAVQRVLGDIGHYGEWWPAPFRFQPADASALPRVRVHNGFLNWTLSVTTVTREQIVLRYEDGAWAGEGRWTVSRCHEGTRVLYRIHLAPRSIFARGLSHAVDLQRRHSHDMLRVFKGLDERLTSLGVPRLPPPDAPESPK